MRGIPLSISAASAPRPGACPTPWLPASPGGRLSTQGRDGDYDQDRDARDGTQAVQPAVAAGGGRQRAGEAARPFLRARLREKAISFIKNHENSCNFNKNHQI